MSFSQFMIIMGITVFLSALFYIVVKIKIRNLKKSKAKKSIPLTSSSTQASSPVYSIPEIRQSDHVLFDKFMKEYAPDGKFTQEFRPGSRMTCPFGISEGFRYLNKNTMKPFDEKNDKLSDRLMKWGYVRIHSGVDQAGAKNHKMSDGTVVKDIVRVPFDFNRSFYEYFGDTSYGTLATLTNDEYQFSFKIAHMDPEKDYIKWSLDQLKARKPMKKGWILGSAGTLGDSSGNHTHNEVVSVDESSEVLELLVSQKYGEKALAEYTDAEIVREYQKYDYFKTASKSEILSDWQAWKTSRKILFINKYFYRFVSWNNKVYTRYSSYLLFDGI